MDIWPQRTHIQKKVLAYRREKGLRPEQLAELLDMQPSHLHGLLYDRRTRIMLEVAQRFAAILGLPLSEIVDDPSSHLPGLANGDLCQISPAKRAVMNMLFQRIKKEDVTDDMAVAYLKILDAAVEAVEAGRVRTPDWGK
jgi:transcriptional regulator with XRE-family HTH domain